MLLVTGSALLGYTLGLPLAVLAGALAALPIEDAIAWSITGFLACGAASGGSILARVINQPLSDGARLVVALAGAAILVAYAVIVEPVDSGFF